MSNLVVIGFDNPADAFQMRGALANMQAQYLIDMEDVVIVTRDVKGAVQLHQARTSPPPVRWAACSGAR